MKVHQTSQRDAVICPEAKKAEMAYRRSRSGSIGPDIFIAGSSGWRT
jgi:hypothetical protein